MFVDNSTDDLFANGIKVWAERIRGGSLSFRETMEVTLQRTANSQTLNAFECLDADRALETAKALDVLLRSGIDYGPLMGLPTGIKDIMSVQGLPTTNGSNADTTDITPAEGTTVKRLREHGCVVMGKTRTVEFALGATGINESRGTPWNPVDRHVHRLPGGSSSGSAVATAAGLVGMALGTDTGGSVRIPACFTGLVGYKSSVGLWPLDGIFELSPTLDSVGPLCRKVDDAALVHTCVTGRTVNGPTSLDGVRVGIPESYFFDDLDQKVADDFEQACQALEQQGARRVPVKFPEANERIGLFTSIVPPELISFLTPARFEAIRAGVDNVTEARAAAGLEVSAHAHLSARRRQKELIKKALHTFQAVDVWLTPTCPFVPMPLDSLSDPEVHARSLLASRNTQPGNLLNMCGLSLPMHTNGLPTGLQVLMPLNQDDELLAIGRTIERVLALRTVS
ncbi:MAG: amidase [Granulosicoccus sp.]